jgi:hypothetical protein
MASLVNPSNINGNFPIAGQDNDSQGFRDNFTNIKNNFTFIKQEVEDLQAKTVLKAALIGSTLDNNFLGSQLKNTQFKNYSETLYDWGNTSGEIQLDLALGNVHRIYTDGDITLNAVTKNWPSSLQYARILLYITISNSTHTLTIPNTISTELANLFGLRKIGGDFVINYSEASTYVYEFSSIDSGTTVYVKELTRANHLFRDPNFYFSAIGAGAESSDHPSGFESPTLKLGWGNLFAVSATIDDSKNGFDVLSVHGSVTSFYNLVDGSNDSADQESAGFSVARSRVANPPAGTAPTQTAAQAVADLDLIGYYNALGYAREQTGALSSFQQFGSIQFYASGIDTSHGIGGNIVIATKQDGGDLTAALVIDNQQNVTITGCLTVNGTTTTINSTNMTVDDKNIIVAQGALNAAAANGGGIAIDTVYANIEYFATSIASAANSNDRFGINKALTITMPTASNASTNGALVVAGGVGIGGDLNVGGTFGLTSSTDSTSKDTGAFVLADGGLGVEKNIVAGGGIFANSTNESSTVTSGALVSAGGLGVAKVSTLGGNVVISATTESTTLDTGALVVKGGVNIQKTLMANTGPVIFGSVTDSTYTMGTTGSTYTGALRVHGGAHIVKTLMIGNDAGDGKIVINTPDVALQATPGTGDTGALIIGNKALSKFGGMSVSGNFNLGSDSGGTLYLFNKNASIGTEIDSTPTPYTVTAGVLGAATIMGGINVFGNIYVGQPSAGAASPDPLVNSGNLIVQSGTPSINSTSGAIVLAKVRMPASLSAERFNDGFSRGGMGMQGNLWAIGNVVLGGSSDVIGSGDGFSNVVINGSRSPTTTTNAGFVVRGGMGVGLVSMFGGNIYANAAYPGLLSSTDPIRQGAIVIPNGGIHAAGISYFGANVVISSAGAGAAGGTTVTGALVLTGTNGIGVGGAASIGGVTKISDNSAGGNGTGALVVTTGGASIAGNLFVQGVTMPINAVGHSGVAVLSATAVAQAVTSATLVDITNLTFTAEANKTYLFEALIFHDCTVGSAAAMAKGFAVTFSAGTCNYVVEQNIISTGSLLVTSGTASATAQIQTTASATSVLGMITKITGTFYHTAIVPAVKLQAQITGGTSPTLSIRGSSFLKWTKLN